MLVHCAENEPSIQTQTLLESSIERQKQFEKTLKDQLRKMSEKSYHQEENLKRLKVECRLKELRIEKLKSQIDPRKSWDTQKTELPRLRAVISEQQSLLERIWRDKGGEVKEKEITSRINNSRGEPVNRSSYESILTEAVDSDEDELTKLREENKAFRLVIARFERENIEISLLREEVLQMGVQLREFQGTVVRPYFG